MVILSTAISACLLFAPLAQAARDYDRARHDGIKRAIEGSQDKMLRMPFDDASRLLSLEGVGWDKAYTNAPNSEFRIYHFRGFYLGVHITKRMPDNPPSWTYEDLRQRGRWYVYHFYPFVHVDGLSDPERRMRDYWAGLAESFRRRNEEARRTPKGGKRAGRVDCARLAEP